MDASKFSITFTETVSSGVVAMLRTWQKAIKEGIEVPTADLPLIQTGEDTYRLAMDGEIPDLILEGVSMNDIRLAEKEVDPASMVEIKLAQIMEEKGLADEFK